MALILGIDAAWTPKSSTGVALMSSSNGTRRVLAASPSYESFVAFVNSSRVDWTRVQGGTPDVTALLATAARLGGAPIDVVAIDMPMARTPIAGRRRADQEVSRAFGAVGAAVHSPSKTRPGEHGERIVQRFIDAGYPLVTESTANPTRRALIEVFPLAALVRLMNLAKRPPYKVAKTTRYWRGQSKDVRVEKLLTKWNEIISSLQAEVGNLGLPVPERSTVETMSALKPYEDALDAIISAWIGAQYIEGRAEPFGCADAAIWIPMENR